MKKILPKLTISAIVAFLVMAIGMFIFNITRKLPITTTYKPVPIIKHAADGTASNTAYSGTVKIEPTTKQAIIEDLEKYGCQNSSQHKGNVSAGACYFITDFSEDDLKHGIGTSGVRVYPFGGGWGPISFDITEDTIYFSEDISGGPDHKKVEAAIREKVTKVLPTIKIREETWHLDKVAYPQDAIY